MARKTLGEGNQSCKHQAQVLVSCLTEESCVGCVGRAVKSISLNFLQHFKRKTSALPKLSPHSKTSIAEGEEVDEPE